MLKLIASRSLRLKPNVRPSAGVEKDRRVGCRYESERPAICPPPYCRRLGPICAAVSHLSATIYFPSGPRFG
jgi:hypothetical protein